MNIEKTLKSLSMEEKLGQMFMARGLKIFPDETNSLIAKGLIGGIHCRAGDTAGEIEKIQDVSPIMLFVATDMETGFVGENFSGTQMPWPMALGAVGSEKLAYKWAQIAARESRAHGVNFVFGPVLDIANEPASPFVNIRSLSADKHEIIRLAAAVIKGYQENGLQISAKHYPGAGRFPADNHIEPMILTCSREEFESEELFVYKELIKRAGLNGVMSGHIAVQAVDRNKPATVSEKLISYLNDFGFKGLLITDSLAMKGIRSQIPLGELLAQSLAAGHDIILGDYNLSPGEQLEYMYRAFKDGIISEEKINNSVGKILKAKDRIQKNIQGKEIDRKQHKAISFEIHRKAISVIGDRKQLGCVRERRTLFIVALEKEEKPVGAEIEIRTVESEMKHLIKKRFPDAEIKIITDHPGPAVIEATLDKALDYNSVVFVAYAMIHSYKGTADFSRRLLALIKGLKEKIKVFIIFGNPYAARELPLLPCRLFAYYGAHAERAAIEALAGDFEPTGKLPVEIKAC